MTKRNRINWFRINRGLHRDIGYFCIGMTIVFAISGIALNHIHDWNSNYKIDKHIYPLKVDGEIVRLLSHPAVTDFDHQLSQLMLQTTKSVSPLKATYWENEWQFKAFLNDGSTITLMTDARQLVYEHVSPRVVLKAFNFLHLNEGRNAWVYFSDLYASLLLFLAISALFMVKGRHSPWRRKSLYVVAGILVPLFFILMS